MPHFFPLVIDRLVPDTSEAMQIHLRIPEEVKDKFRFKQGQYLTFRLELGGEELRRSYSLCNAPSENPETLEVLVKKLEGGRVSTYLNEQLKVGQTLDTMPPMGLFQTAHNPRNKRTYVGIAAGSGITPVLSNLKEALLQEPLSDAHLIYSNRSVDLVLKKEEIQKIQAQFGNRLQIHYLMSREKTDDPLFEGRISGDKVAKLLQRFPNLDLREAVYFLCGPSDMIKEVSSYLKNNEKVPAIQVLYEYFSAPDDEENAEMSEEFKAIPNVESFVTVILDDDEYSFHLNSKKDNILDKALKEKMPVPYACKGGVCCTCKAQILEGEVFMEKNYALTEEEVQNGYVLTCQCHPTTNVVMLSFDV